MSKGMKAVLVVTIIVMVGLLAAVFIVLRDQSNDRKAADSETAAATEAVTTEGSEEGDTTASEASDTGSADSTKPENVTDMVNQLKPLMKLDRTSDLDEEKIAYYYDLDKEDIDDCHGVISDVALADELVIIKAASGKVDAVKKGAEKRLSDQKDSFQDYIPEQRDRLDGAVVEADGDYVIYVCSDHTDDILSKFRSYVE